jgi:hypothetical protein
LFVLVLSAGLQFLIIEFGGEVFRTVPLSWSDWLICIAFGFGSIPVGFFIRMIAPEVKDVVVADEKEEIMIHDEVVDLHSAIIGFLEQVFNSTLMFSVLDTVSGNARVLIGLLPLTKHHTTFTRPGRST